MAMASLSSIVRTRGATARKLSRGKSEPATAPPRVLFFHQGLWIYQREAGTTGTTLLVIMIYLLVTTNLSDNAAQRPEYPFFLIKHRDY